MGTCRLLVAALLAASACRTVDVRVRTTLDVNDGQPVALHLHQLRSLPAGLGTLGCADLRDGGPVDTARVGDPAIVSALPARTTTIAVDRQPAARWMLVVPEWSSCDDADAWALVPLAPAARAVRLSLAGDAVGLPWDRRPDTDDGRRWHQRGYVDGQPFHVVARRPRALR
ncbi:MAG: hypothetical protein H6733_06750 [Alphaproteobacteria bacterium]|nr:hypothetical protein [Alphaproteobacteria bacterium]